MNRRAEAVTALERRLGHAFADPSLLERALTHPSAGSGSAKIAHNQVLEFLGDRVLGLLAAEALVIMNPHWREGELSRRHVALVSGPVCAKVARDLDVGPALRMEGAQAASGGRDSPRILGDAMEAILAAIYLDAGLDAAREVFQRVWRDLLEEAPGALRLDAKTRLNEWAGARGLPPPTYETLSRGSNAAPLFVVEVSAGDLPPARGEAGTVKGAEQAAAEALLTREGADA